MINNNYNTKNNGKILKQKLDQLKVYKSNIIYFTKNDIIRAEMLSKKIIIYKTNEQVHIQDHKDENKRWMTGILGEIAIEKLFNIKFIDSTVGNSNKYSYADLKNAGYNVGVKSFRYPNFPVINRNIKEPQIFILISKKGLCAIVLGIADMKLLNNCINNKENDIYLVNKDMLKRKTAFIDIDKLKPINTIDDIKCYKFK